MQFSAIASESCGNGTINYSWHLGDPANTVVTGPNPSFQYPVPGTYTVNVSATDGTNTIPKQFQQVVQPTSITISQASFSPNAPTVCDTVQFNASATAGCGASGVTYTWDFGDGSTGSGPSPTHKFGTAKTYTVVLTASDSTDPAATKTLSVPVGAGVTPGMPTGVTATGGNCAGNIDLKWSAVSGATGYNIYRNGSKIGTTSNTSYSDFGGSTGTNSYYVTAINGCGTEGPPSATVSATVASGSVPVTITPSSASACTNQSLQFMATYNMPACESGGVPSLKWYVDGTLASSTTSTLNTSFATGGGHTVTFVVSGTCGCGHGTANVTVTAAGITIISVSGMPSPATTCDIVDFGATASSNCAGSPLSYAWTFGDGASASGQYPFHQYATAKDYTVTVTVTDGINTPATKSYTLTITAPSAPGKVTGLKVTPVSSTQNNLTWNPVSGASGYNVYRSLDGQTWTRIASTTDPSYKDIGLTASTNYYYRVTAFACGSGTGGGGSQGPEGPPSDPVFGPTPCNDSITLGNPTGGPTPTFPGTSVSFNVSGSETCGNGLSYLWDFQDGTTGSGASPSHAFSQTGNYNVTVNASDGPFSASGGSVPIVVWDFSLGVILPSSMTQGTTASGSLQINPINGYTGTILATISGGGNGIHVSLIDPNAPSCPGLLAASSSVVVNVSSPVTIGIQVCADANATPGTYPVTITGQDLASGTQHSVTVYITVQQYVGSANLTGQSVRLALGRPLDSPGTILDEVGRLAHDVSDTQAQVWRARLHTFPARLDHIPVPQIAEATLLHLRLGEYELAHSQQPRLAMWHFRQVQCLTTPSSSAFGLAAYDTATALFYQGAYQDAADTFQQLLNRKTALPGYDRRTASLWYRHAEALAGYHAGCAALGIPEPPRLDPMCAAAALATCLKALSLPYDRASVLQGCRVTGEGSSLADVVAAGRKLHVTVRAITATDQGLIALPKPLVAYVENDHFVALVRADRQGVSYLCSDCGMWPGGKVDLTWKQWHALNPGIYAAVTLPHSFSDQALARVLSPSSLPRAPFRVAGLGSLHGLRSPYALALIHYGSQLQGRVARFDLPTGPITCGAKLDAQRGSPFANGAHDGDPVNLATGEEEYTPTPDLVVYNPNGPPVVWSRVYNSYRGPEPAYEPADYGVGWSHPYNVSVYDANYDPSAPNYATPTGPKSGNKSIVFDNGSRLQFTAASVPTASSPRVICTAAVSTLTSPIQMEWDYSATNAAGYFTITFKDRTHWITGPINTGTGCYSLSQITNQTGNGLQLVYGGNPGISVTYGTGPAPNPAVPSLCNWPVLTSIKDLKSQTILLAIKRDGNRAITSVTDAYGRTVYYQVTSHPNTNVPCGYPQTSLELDKVSQIVTSSTSSSSAPSRYSYGYQNYTNYDGVGTAHPETTPYLATISRPSPTTTGTSTLTINYDSTKVFVSSVQDGSGNVRSYTDLGGAKTKVTVTTAGQLVNSYIVGYDASLQNQISQTDGGGNVIFSQAYSDPNYKFAPSSITDGNGKVWQYAYDPFGNLQSVTTPRGTTTNYTWGYPAATSPGLPNSVVKANAFFMGELLSEQEGTKSPTTYDDYEEGDPSGNPPGLIHTIKTPAANTVGGTTTTTTTFTYNSLGDIVTSTTPASATTGTITTTFNYTQDGTYSLPSPLLRQPLTITDNLGNTTHFRYDAQGNMISVVDSLGHETDYGDASKYNGYNIANQPVLVTYPATGQTGSGRSYATSTYLFPGGPLLTAQSYDESGSSTPVRQVKYTLGQEGEVLGISGSTEPVTYTYDGDYRPLTLTDGNNHVTHYYYNGLGYLDSVTYPGYAGPAPVYNTTSGTWSNVSGLDSEHYLYTNSSGQYVDGSGNPDFNGHIKRFIDGSGIERDFDYTDPENLPKSVHYPGGQLPDITNTYDTVYGRLTAMADGTVSKTYGYDDLDNVLSVKTSYVGGPQNVIQNYVYNPDSSLQSMSTPAGSFSYAYDGDGRPHSLTNPYSETSQWTYPDATPVATQTLGNGVTTTVTMNPMGQMLDQTTKAGSTVLSEFVVPATGGYDSHGNLQSVTASTPAYTPFNGTTTYTYDNGQTANPLLRRDQLTAEQSTRFGSNAVTYSYDTAGNLTSFPISGFHSPSGTNAYNVDNQNSASNYTYDGSGNPTTYKGSVLVFDAENRLIGIPSLNWSAGYTADGLRAWKQTASGGTYYLYDGGDPVCELDSVGNVLATNTFGGSLLSRHTGPVAGGSSTFYTFDERGNTVQRLSASGSVLSTDLDTAWGPAQTASDPFGYQGADGYYTDTETGLLYLHARYYDPGTGRFVTRDPAGYGGGINLYSYAKNNPVNSSDPSGLSSDDNGDYDLDHRFGGGGSEGSIIGAGLIQFGQQQQFQPGSQARGDLAGAARQIPGAGVVIMAAGAATGCDYLAGTHESGADRGWDAFGAVLSALPFASKMRPFSRISGPLSECAGNGGCFIAGTPVTLADGTTKPIEQVQKDDLVLSRDPDTGKTEGKKVLSTSVVTKYDVVTVTTADAKTHQVVDRLTVTPEHPWHTDTGWVLAGNLAVGTSILTRAGPSVVVQSVEKKHSAAGIQVYNFLVADDHTYFVGNQDEWVHNGWPCDITRGLAKVRQLHDERFMDDEIAANRYNTTAVLETTIGDFIGVNKKGLHAEEDAIAQARDAGLADSDMIIMNVSRPPCPKLCTPMLQNMGLTARYWYGKARETLQSSW